MNGMTGYDIKKLVLLSFLYVNYSIDVHFSHLEEIIYINYKILYTYREIEI